MLNALYLLGLVSLVVSLFVWWKNSRREDIYIQAVNVCCPYCGRIMRIQAKRGDVQ